MADDMFDERAAGVRLGGTDRPISPRTFQRWRQRGAGPKFVRVGNQIRYRRQDLDQWLEDRVAQSTVEKLGVRS
jgi:hypothetical protein